uniref:Uncharacterized protein n=1 Tax=Hemiselmis andersenii TaxID=464988 RepID=A0A7S1DV65_HEMAN
MADPLAPKDVDPRLTALLARVRKSIVGKDTDEPEVNEIADKVEGSLRKRWEKPPTEEMEIVLRKRMVDDEARQVLFFPTDQDMHYYQALILSPPDGSPKDHPANAVQQTAVPLLYLAHSRRWALAREFILGGGLASLVTLVTHENLYLRSQAVETFSAMTDRCEDVDWLDVDDANEKLRRQLFGLSASCDIVKALLGNMKGSYPNGGFSCLRILAFWLSWVRALYCPERKLRLSQKVLDALKEWSVYEGVSCKEEADLAKILFDDFNRLPAAPSPESPPQGEAAAGGPGGGHGLCLEGAKEGGLSVEDLRLEGNAQLQAGDFKLAEKTYTRAVKKSVDEAGGEGEGEPACLLNRALARLKLTPANHQGALDDCNIVIKTQENNAKAHYRRAQALEGLGRTPKQHANRSQPDPLCALSPRVACVYVYIHLEGDIHIYICMFGRERG